MPMRWSKPLAKTPVATSICSGWSTKGFTSRGGTVPPGTYSARGAGGHYLVVIPALDLVVVHRFDNDPPRRDPATVTECAGHGIGKTEFGRLLKLILDAKLH
jgi:CubicO group peptidase (beta-lactamase class C family)